MKLDAKLYKVLSGGRIPAAISAVILFATLFRVTPSDATQSPANLSSYITPTLQADPKVHAPSDSFRMHLRAPHYSDDIIVNIRKNRSKFVRRYAGVTYYGYQVGNVMYFTVADGTWLKADLDQPKAAATSSRQTASSPVRHHLNGQLAHHLPDRIVNGIRMTVSSIQVPEQAFDAESLSGRMITLTCLSEKRTGLLSSCGAGKRQMTFDHFNDPSNDFIVPKPALHAQELPF
jgi:hypothetical protein